MNAFPKRQEKYFAMFLTLEELKNLQKISSTGECADTTKQSKKSYNYPPLIFGLSTSSDWIPSVGGLLNISFVIIRRLSAPPVYTQMTTFAGLQIVVTSRDQHLFTVRTLPLVFFKFHKMLFNSKGKKRKPFKKRNGKICCTFYYFF